MRFGLYFLAGVFFALWFSLEILGAAGFVAFCIGMLAAQATWRLRPRLNMAFASGLTTYILVLAIWTVAFGAPSPSKRNPTETPAVPLTAVDS
jgi:hypothetical protein